MKRIVLALLVLLVAGSAWAQTGLVSSEGLTGLWRFQDSAHKLQATVGTDLTASFPGAASLTGPYTVINPGLTDSGILQTLGNEYLTVTHGIAPNGGGQGWNTTTWDPDPNGTYFVNQYTIAMDYHQTSGFDAWNSLYQTSMGPHDNDGDLFIAYDGTIGIGGPGYSASSINPDAWHRIVLSVDNGSDDDGTGGFFRVYVDGTKVVDGAGQGIDGRFALYPDHVFLFADNDGDSQWGMIGTLATWNRPLSNEEVFNMGGWLGGGEPTPLTIVPEPGTFVLLAAGLLMVFVIRKKK
jgi:hypothetical protein